MEYIEQIKLFLSFFFFAILCCRSRAKVNKVAGGEPMTETTNTTVIMNPKMEHVVEVIQTDGNSKENTGLVN